VVASQKKEKPISLAPVEKVTSFGWDEDGGLDESPRAEVEQTQKPTTNEKVTTNAVKAEKIEGGFGWDDDGGLDEEDSPRDEAVRVEQTAKAVSPLVESPEKDDLLKSAKNEPFEEKKENTNSPKLSSKVERVENIGWGDDSDALEEDTPVSVSEKTGKNVEKVQDFDFSD